MSLLAPPEELFNWLEQSGVTYVVLRDGHRVNRERLEDIDLLVDDAAINGLKTTFRKRRRGLKVDCYGVKGLYGSDYHGFPHLPEPLGEQILRHRQKIDGVWLPQPIDELNALLYHVVYHKNLQSGFHAFEPDLAKPGTYSARIVELQANCGLALSPTHERFHTHLSALGLAVDEKRLIAYLEHDFRYGRKSLFHARLQNEHPGELNLFVIRAIAIRHHKSEALLDFLAGRYRIVTTKPVDWWTRVTRARHMRGGKWRRGGRPHIAVVGFDSSPSPSTPEEHEAHPFVFNRNQFIKLQWRDWFCRNTSARVKDNPIHSTDNEAEALGHLPLFFSSEERVRIHDSLPGLRTEAQP